MDILLIEPDASFAGEIKRQLEKDNHTVNIALDGVSGLSFAFSHHLDIIVMERFIKDIDGITLCKELLKRHDIPLLMLSDISDRNDKILCIGTGVEEYIEKPVRALDVLYHVRRIIKNKEQFSDKRHDSMLRLDDILSINCRTKQVLIKGEELSLSGKEYEIFEFLLSHRGKIFSKQEIYEYIWNEPEYYDTGYVTTYINRLRNKFSKYGLNPIKTIRLKGYLIEE